MRVIGKFDDQTQAESFRQFLFNHNIEAIVEKEGKDFQIWVIQEEDLESAQRHFLSFSNHPTQKKAQVELEKPSPLPFPSLLQTVPDCSPPTISFKEKPFQPWMTKTLLGVCIVLFLWMWSQAKPMKEPISETSTFASSRLFRILAYDYPKAIEKKGLFFQKQKIDSKEGVLSLSKEKQKEYAEIEKIPLWKGIYSLLLNWPSSKQELQSGLFYQISKGEIWRIFTPAFLHSGWIHLFLNMWFFWVVGLQVEERTHRGKYLLLILLLAAISNTVQYLMSGPMFLGFSGILCGLTSFIWMRQKIAPWQGYPLPSFAATFLAIFVFGLLGLQVVFFLLALLGNAPASAGIIANSAHVSGLICGALIGKIPFFSK